MAKANPKYPHYHDYVIKGSKLVGEFEEMYRDYDDPWEQTTREEWTSEKAIALHLIKKLKAKKVIELGCGLGHFTNKIAKLGVDVLGIDISKTAIEKAKTQYSNCNFAVGDVLDFDLYREYKPDIIIMAEITWYILDKLDRFLEFLRSEMPDTYIIHLLTTYEEGVQKYGREKFTNLSQIMAYFGAKYLEWGEISYAEMDDSKRTYFLGRFASIEPDK